MANGIQEALKCGAFLPDEFITRANRHSTITPFLAILHCRGDGVILPPRAITPCRTAHLRVSPPVPQPPSLANEAG